MKTENLRQTTTAFSSPAHLLQRVKVQKQMTMLKSHHTGLELLRKLLARNMDSRKRYVFAKVWLRHIHLVFQGWVLGFFVAGLIDLLSIIHAKQSADIARTLLGVLGFNKALSKDRRLGKRHVADPERHQSPRRTSFSKCRDHVFGHRPRRNHTRGS